MRKQAVSHYEVEYCNCVDHPERRDSSFSPVPAGFRRAHSERFSTQGAAVRYFEGLLRGESDFSSEYICWAAVYRCYAHRSGKCIRRRVDRERPARWVYDHEPAPKNVKGWSCVDGSPAAYCAVCEADLAEDGPCEHVDPEALANWLALGKKE